MAESYKTKDGVAVQVTLAEPGKAVNATVKKLLDAVGLAPTKIVEPIYLIEFPDGTKKAAHPRNFSDNFTKA